MVLKDASSAQLAAGVSVSLGKGAWDCDTGCAIAAEKEVGSTDHKEGVHDCFLLDCKCMQANSFWLEWN